MPNDKKFSYGNIYIGKSERDDSCIEYVIRSDEKVVKTGLISKVQLEEIGGLNDLIYLLRIQTFQPDEVIRRKAYLTKILQIVSSKEQIKFNNKIETTTLLETDKSRKFEDENSGGPIDQLLEKNIDGDIKISPEEPLLKKEKDLEKQKKDILKKLDKLNERREEVSYDRYFGNAVYPTREVREIFRNHNKPLIDIKNLNKSRKTESEIQGKEKELKRLQKELVRVKENIKENEIIQYLDIAGTESECLEIFKYARNHIKDYKFIEVLRKKVIDKIKILKTVKAESDKTIRTKIINRFINDLEKSKLVGDIQNAKDKAEMEIYNRLSNNGQLSLEDMELRQKIEIIAVRKSITVLHTSFERELKDEHSVEGVLDLTYRVKLSFTHLNSATKAIQINAENTRIDRIATDKISSILNEGLLSFKNEIKSLSRDDLNESVGTIKVKITSLLAKIPDNMRSYKTIINNFKDNIENLSKTRLQEIEASATYSRAKGSVSFFQYTSDSNAERAKTSTAEAERAAKKIHNLDDPKARFSKVIANQPSARNGR